MKKLLTTILVTLSLNAQSTSNIDVAKYLTANNKNCESVSHIELIKYGNIDIYDITCINNNGIFIYQYVAEQIVTTHFIAN